MASNPGDRNLAGATPDVDPVAADWLRPTGSADYRTVAAAIRHAVDLRDQQPSLAALAAHVGLSRFHFQRLFVRWAGVSPKQFLGFLTLDYAKRLLGDNATVLEAAFAAGLSGPGRLHDLFVSIEAMTPGEYRAAGRRLEIHHAVVETAFGSALVLVTARGLCGLRFVDGATGDSELAAARREWPLSRFIADRKPVDAVLGRLFPTAGGARVPVPLLVRGSRFQLKVWEALLRLPSGSVCCYSQLAGVVGSPTAARSVGSALAANPVAVLIPCHRVLRASGAVGGYRWGETRKAALIAREQAAAAAAREGNGARDYLL